RVVKAVRVINATADGASAKTGAHLMIAVDILPGIIRFHPVNFVVTDMQAQRAAAAAVHRAGSPDHFIFSRLYGVLHRSSGAFQSKRQRDTTGGKRQRTYRGGLNECSAANSTVMFDIGHGSPHHFN